LKSLPAAQATLRHRAGADMATLQLCAIWTLLSIGAAGACLAWWLM